MRMASTCMTCHSVQRLQTTAGNGGFVMGVPAVMVDEKGNPNSRAKCPTTEIRATSRAPFASRYHERPVARRPEFCAALPQGQPAAFPERLQVAARLYRVRRVAELEDSRKRNPLTFYSGDFTTCQGCHMKRNELTLPDRGAKHNTLVSHRWLAGNTAVPFYYGFDEQLKKTTEFLQSGNYLNVDLFAIRKGSGEKLIAPLGEAVPFRLAPNDVVQTMVVIQNRNIGHSLIPEVRDLYEAWVEFTVKDGSGKEFYRSGFLKANGTLDDRAHSFTNRLVNTDDGFVDNYKVWTIHAVAYDNTVPAGRSTLVRYEFRIPAGAKGPLTLTARVNYRHLRQSYLNNVLGEDHPAYPVVEIASRTRVLNIGDNPATGADPKDNPAWMRWNNCGIAYLDQFQYAEAADAFSQVVKLRPDYADGYTNVALTNMVWEKYGSARAAEARALALNSKDARALYYMALLERRAGHTDVETAELNEGSSRQYPESRDGRRDAGNRVVPPTEISGGRRTVRGAAGDRFRRCGRALQPLAPLSPHGDG